MFKRAVGKKKKCRKMHGEHMGPYKESSRILSALDERILDMERRGRSRKKKRSPPLKPTLKRAASTPSTVPCHFDNRCGNSDYQCKSVRFQTYPYPCHVSGMSPPPCYMKSSLKDSCRYTPASKGLASIPSSGGDTICSGSKNYLLDPSSGENSMNNNYTCISSVPLFPSYSADILSNKYGIPDYNKVSGSRNCKTAMKLDELMLKYNEFSTPTAKSYKSSVSPYSVGSFDSKHSYSNTSWKPETSGGSLKTYTSPYRDYNTSFSKYASYYGDGQAINSYGGHYADPFRSLNNKSAYNSDLDWPSSKVTSELDVRSMRGNPLKQTYDLGFKLPSCGTDTGNNLYPAAASASGKLNSEDFKYVPGSSISYSLSKLKSELFSSGSVLQNQENEAARVSSMLSEYRRMDYYRKTIQSQRAKNLELLEKYVFAKPKNASASLEFMANKNENRKSFDVIRPGNSVLDESNFNKLKNKYDPPLSTTLMNELSRYRTTKYSHSADSLPLISRSRSLSSGAADRKKLTDVKSVLDVSRESRWPLVSKFISKCLKVDDAKSMFMSSNDSSSFLKDHGAGRSKTPEDYLGRSQLHGALSRDYKRSPSIEKDAMFQNYSHLKYGSNRSQNYSPVKMNKDYSDAGSRDASSMFNVNSSKTKLSTPSNYTMSQDVHCSKSTGNKLTSDYCSSDFSSFFSKYGTRSEGKNSYSMNETNNWTGKNPCTMVGAKKMDTTSPSFYLGTRTMRDYSTNAKQDSTAIKAADDADYYGLGLIKNAENSPRKGGANGAAQYSGGGVNQDLFVSSNIASKVPPVSYSCKHVINLCLDDEGNRLKNIDSLIKKTTLNNNSSNSNQVPKKVSSREK